MRSSCKTLFSGSDKAQCWAWENLRSSSSFVVTLTKNTLTGATTKQKGATTVHSGPNHFDDALKATEANYNQMISLGWQGTKRGYAGRQVPNSGRTPPTGRTTARPGGYSSPASSYTPPKASPFASPTAAPPPVADLSISEFADVDSAARAIVREGFRTLAMKHHPDKGGTHATMAMLTETKHQLMKMLDLIKD